MKFKNYLFLSSALLIFTGCSLKSKVDVYSQNLYESPEEYVKIAHFKSKEILPSKINSPHLSGTFIKTIAHRDTLIGVIEDVQPFSLLKQGQKKALEFGKEKFCKKEIHMRALIEHGVKIKLNLFNKEKTDSVTILIDKESCNKSYPLT